MLLFTSNFTNPKIDSMAARNARRIRKAGGREGVREEVRVGGRRPVSYFIACKFDEFYPR